MGLPKFHEFEQAYWKTYYKDLERNMSMSKYDIDELNKKHSENFVPYAGLNDIQFGGDHYKQFKDYQPWDVIEAWGLGYLDGTALKYIARWRHKGGLEDIRKAIHFLQKFLEVEEAKQNGKT